MTVADVLRKVPFFAELGDDEIASLADIAQISCTPAGAVVFHEGEPGESMYVILEGAVRVFQRGDDGAEHELTRLEQGSYFGEMAIIDGAPRSASVEAEQYCELVMLGREPFLNLMSRSTKLLREILSGFSEKVRASDSKLFELRLEQERRKAQEEIERHKSIAQMVAGVAHEINTPLGIINQAASVITGTVTDVALDELAKDEDARDNLEDVRDAGQLILSNAERARKLVTSFKNLSVRQVTDDKETVDIAALLEEVVGLYRFQARASNLDTNIESRIEGDGTWEGYPDYFSQIVLNLLSNVDRYGYPGGGGRVDIRLTEAGDSYELGVTDYGEGMTQADASRVFEPFFTTGRNKGGTGLGMSIVHNLVTSALDGAIEIASAPGEGTTVTVKLPRTVKTKAWSDADDEEEQ